MSESLTYVTSRYQNACVVACLAMVTGQTMDQVLVGMEQYWKNEGEDEGIDDDPMIQYLSARGYAVQRVEHEYTPEDRLISPWPPEPFAPAHIVFLYDEGGHSVVMDSKGLVLDPNDETKKSLEDYHRVYYVLGIWKVRDSLPFIKSSTKTKIKKRPASRMRKHL